MRRIDKIKSLSLDKFADWLDKYGMFEDSPWLNWWNETYCNNCKSEIVRVVENGREMECAWCEIYDKCKFFQDMKSAPDTKQIIKMWLEGESDD